MYLAAKSLHVMAVISWMAGLLYLWRLFVYHAMEPEQIVRDRFEVMERRLLRAIATPAAIVAGLTGAAMLILAPGLLASPSIQIKLACVALLVANHVHAASVRRRLLRADANLSPRAMRVYNEVPTLLMIVIVTMVVARPC
jgi:putative membrane protein